MENDPTLLADLSTKALILEERIEASNSPKHLLEIAQEAAASYHILATKLFDKSVADRERLSELSKRFGWIENEAVRKFYGRAGKTQKRLLLWE